MSKYHETESAPNGMDLAGGLCEPAKRPREMSVVTRQLVQMFRCVDRTISRWRQKGVLPPPFKIGNANAWNVGAIMDHFQKLQDDAVKVGLSRNRRMAAAPSGTLADEHLRMNAQTIARMTGGKD